MCQHVRSIDVNRKFLAAYKPNKSTIEGGGDNLPTHADYRHTIRFLRCIALVHEPPLTALRLQIKRLSGGFWQEKGNLVYK